MIEVSKLTYHRYPKRLLRFDKFLIEQVDQDIAFPRVQRVILTQRQDSRVAFVLNFRRLVLS